MELRMEKHTFLDSLERTIESCAWLIDIAKASVVGYGWHPSLVRYLEQLGQAAYAERERQLGGMGAVAPMVTR